MAALDPFSDATAGEPVSHLLRDIAAAAKATSEARNRIRRRVAVNLPWVGQGPTELTLLRLGLTADVDIRAKCAHYKPPNLPARADPPLLRNICCCLLCALQFILESRTRHDSSKCTIQCQRQRLSRISRLDARKAKDISSSAEEQPVFPSSSSPSRKLSSYCQSSGSL